MASRLHYNWTSGQTDRRQGHGYGKSQKTPSFGTGLGSERAMGSSSTGIYPEPPLEYEDEDEEDLGNLNIDKFVKMINKDVKRSNPGFWPRADRSSLGQSGNSTAIAALALTEKSLPVPKGQSLPKASNSIAPFPHRVLYPGGFDGGPYGTGNAAQAFRTTGPARKTGTLQGFSSSPVNREDEDDFHIMSFEDIASMDPSERALAKQRIKIMKVLNRIDEIEEYYDV